MTQLNLGSFLTTLGKSTVTGDSSGIISGWILNKVSAVEKNQVLFLENKNYSLDKVYQAYLQGAKAVVVDHPTVLPSRWKDRCLIKVPNTRQALRAFIRYHRSKFHIPVIGITGSVGKSTTKEMIASILRQQWKIVKTAGNMNLSAHIVTFLGQLTPEHKAAVFEMGMNCFNEIKTQCSLARPTIGVMTKIGENHVGKLMNKIENVVKAKQELIDGLYSKGLLILNADDPYTKMFKTNKFKGRIQYYSQKKKADFWASDITSTNKGIRYKAHFNGQTHVFTIPCFGRHNVSNALAATAVAHNLGFSAEHIRKGLAKYKAPKWRLQVVKGINGSLLINDSYNASPTSMRAGIDVLKELASDKTSIAVLGDMLELGAQSDPSHRKVGKYVAKKNVDYLYTIGNLARQIALAAREGGMAASHIQSFASRQNALPVLRRKLNSDTVAFFKASRKAALEKLVKKLKTKIKENPPD
ncbi:MAG: UDP-N-acetylmuramoyl-tripeptide--D-alanyl-D-alanine ligase [Clostridia bacterium]|nr:UDP-N-acetylmuramoyl-tripeptide--D-alanyl-D-alanine ligase [Clostridia bacterium]